ncbi:hypothetical protein WH297_18395 [Ochrobactrum vermis]|uniref:Uncharacterized protein n=1 Tax=Ochrobactrum vermis TaxID=1827297 RepID=A0ABU8PJ60_9HYPH|nr:hypothetical protein [Ochrobactrum vermis]
MNWNVLISQENVWLLLPLLQRFQDVPPALLAFIFLQAKCSQIVKGWAKRQAGKCVRGE